MNAKIMKGKSAGGLIDYLNSMKGKNAKVIFSNGVSRSLRLMTAKSWISGAPSTAAPLIAAVMPGITSISMGGYCWASS